MADDLNNVKRKKRQKSEKTPKRPRTSSKRKPGFDKDIYKETEYYIKDGLRHVKPYPFTFTTYCKGRWLRRKLLDVLSQEFQSETTEYYRKAIETGNITVNGADVQEDLILKDNDIISHKVHRHEPPVTTEAIQIISETEDIVVVNKPSSIPIHPCGRYRHNTLVFLLGREFGLTNLYTIHRIDRLTSGIVMFAKSLEKAQQLEKQLRQRELEKEYVCKVEGEFPSGVVDCNEPIIVVSHKVGVCRVHADGKQCRTVFTRQSFDGTNSIVKCQPHTGRMHQIRVHLQWLGYPIVDDPIYNHEAWGLTKGKGGVEEEKAWKVIESIATTLRSNDVGEDTQANSHDGSTSNKENPLTDEKSKPSSLTAEQVGKEIVSSKESHAVLEKNDDVGAFSLTVEQVENEILSSSDSQAVLEKNPDVEHSDKCCDQKESLFGEKPKDCSLISEQVHKEIRSSEQAMFEKNPNVDHRNDEQTRGSSGEKPGECSSTSEQSTSSTSSKSDIRQAVQDETRTHQDWKQDLVPGCTECQIKRRDPTPAELTMCLHAAVYKGPDWEFRCPWPRWALPNMDIQTTE